MPSVDEIMALATANADAASQQAAAGVAGRPTPRGQQQGTATPPPAAPSSPAAPAAGGPTAPAAGSRQINPDPGPPSVDPNQEHALQALRQQLAETQAALEAARVQAAQQSRTTRFATPGPEATPDNTKEAPVAGSIDLDDEEMEIVLAQRKQKADFAAAARKRRVSIEATLRNLRKGHVDWSVVSPEMAENPEIQEAAFGAIAMARLQGKDRPAGMSDKFIEALAAGTGASLNGSSPLALGSGSDGSKPGDGNVIDGEKAPSALERAARDRAVELMKQGDGKEHLEKVVIPTLLTEYKGLFGDLKDPKQEQLLLSVLNDADQEVSK